MLPIFVYGTLLPDQPNFYLWHDAIISMRPAQLPDACLYDMGMFPMLIEGANGMVQGAVGHVKAEQYAHVLAQLDKLEEYDPQRPEASAYRRVRRTVKMDTGESAEVWVYVGNRAFIATQSLIPSGDWVDYTQHNMIDIRNWWQNWEQSPLFEK